MRSAILLTLLSISAASAQDQWVSLFDGKTLKGWRIASRPEDEKKGLWKVEDGVITLDSRGRKEHGSVYLLNNRELYDFDLKLKVRAVQGNSSVQIRGHFDLDNFVMDGPRVALPTGVLYDETRGARPIAIPAQSNQGTEGWAELLIECRGTRITTSLNGTRVASFEGAGLLNDEPHKIRNSGIHGSIALWLPSAEEGYVQFKDIQLRLAPDPLPNRVTPATAGQAPSDAIVLFDGKDLSQWSLTDGSLDGWTVEDGVILNKAERKEGEQRRNFDLYTKRKFGSAQIHLEYNIPNMPESTGQGKGNSGVKLQTRYEIQILDSIDNPTYPHGTNASLYNFFPPSVNASAMPGQWQTFDIVFHQPKCANNRMLEPGRLTLLHNGVLVQDHVPVVPRQGCPEGPDKLLLQAHFHPNAKQTPMKFRNIWLRPID